MPSENKTKNLSLNQWAGNEYVKRQDFNDDNKKIDDAIGEVKSQLEDMTKQIEGIELTAEKVNLSGITGIKSNNVKGAIQELFTNVSNGKNLVGTAITDIDNNLTVPTEPTFKQLADLIGSISIGKKWAKGTVYSTNSLPVRIEVRGLTFKPSLIIATYQTNYFSIYSEALVLTHYINRQVRDTATPRDLNLLDIYDDGFRIEPAVGGSEVFHRWVAFE